MWTTRTEQAASRKSVRYMVDFAGKSVTFGDVIDAWKADAEFRIWFNDLLANAPFQAYRWETPSLTTATQTRPFEFVVLDSPGLARQADRDAFAAHFKHAEAVVYGRGGRLLAPHPTR